MKQQRSRAAGRRKKVAVEDLPDDSIIDDATTSGARHMPRQGQGQIEGLD